MKALLDRVCRGCGWPAVHGQDSCEGCARAPWEGKPYYSKRAQARIAKGY